MNPKLKERILAYNRALAIRTEKAADLDALVACILKLPPGQLKKVFSTDVAAVLEKYGVSIQDPYVES